MGSKREGSRQAKMAQATTQVEGAAPARAPLWIIVLIVVIPIAVVSLFWQFSSGFRSAPGGGTQPGASASAEKPHESDEQLREMATKLAARLEKQPDDVEGMAMLARTYYTTRDYAKAVAVFERLLPKIPDDASILADYADALAVTNGNSLAGKPMELVQRALKADPTHWKALAMAATDAFRRKDFAGAIRHWEKARGSVPAGSEMVRSIDASIAQARELAGKP